MATNGATGCRSAPSTSDLTPGHEEKYIYQRYANRSHSLLLQNFRAFCMTCSDSIRTFQPSDALPILGWFPDFLRTNTWHKLRSDAICGATVAGLVVPQGMAYGMLAELPPMCGLYTALLPPLAYMTLGTCKHLCIGPFALVSMFTAEAILTVVPKPREDPEGAIAAAGVLAFCVGCVLLTLGFLRLGFIATFLSDPVLSGFCTAVSVLTPVAQLKYALQVPVSSRTFTGNVRELIDGVRLGHANVASLTIFLVSLASILVAQALNKSAHPVLRVLKKFPLPGELLVLSTSTAACYALRLGDQHGVRLLGQIPNGLPTPSLPSLGRFDLHSLLQSVATLSIVTCIVSMSTARSFARKHGYEIDNNQELVALGFGNLAASVSCGYPAAASLSRTAVVGASGPATPCHNAWAVLCVAAVLLLCGSLVETLPYAALSAIVVMAFRPMIENGLRELKGMWGENFEDFIMWNVAFWSTLFTNASLGVVVAASADMCNLLYKTTRPSYSVLGRLEGDERLYRDRRHWPSARIIPGVLIFRFDSALHFANREVFTASVWRELRLHEAELNGSGKPEVNFWKSFRMIGEAITERMSPTAPRDTERKVQAVVLDCSPITRVDVTAVRALDRLRRELCDRGVRLVLAHCKYGVYRRLADMQIFESFEKSGRFDVICFRDLHDAILFVEGRHPLMPQDSGTAESKDNKPMADMLMQSGVAMGSNEAAAEISPGRPPDDDDDDPEM